MMGLAAVSFGIFWQDWHLPHPVAALATLLVGMAGGTLNAALIARAGVPALIVTLGSMALFRGVAEGLTEAAVGYSGFPGSFLFLGQGYLALGLPAQLPIFAAVVAGYAVLLHRSIIGRALYCDRLQRASRAIRRPPGGAPTVARVRPVGIRRQPGRRDLRGAHGSGALRRRHRVRAQCDHCGAARRCVGDRRARHHPRARSSDSSSCRCSRMACSSPRSPPSWPAS
jgi:hypothetical protein